jgi:hypothetical protein
MASAFLDGDSHRRLIRRIAACTHTLYSVAEEIEEVDAIASNDVFAANGIDYVSADQRADLVIAVENLIDIAVFLTDKTRDMAWKHAPSPVPNTTEDDF